MLFSDECGPDGTTPDGAPCTPNTPPPPPPPPPPVPPPPGGEGQDNPNPSIRGGDDWPTYFGPRTLNFDFGTAPRFTAPTFRAPTRADAENEPGYAFARDEGLGALESSNAARGMARTGGAYKGLIAYGNKFAEQNFGNVYNRALSAFDRLYQGKLAEYSPLLAEWQTNALGKMKGGELGFARAWEEYLAQIEKYRWQNPSASDILNAEMNG